MLRCPIVGLDFGHTEFEEEHLQSKSYQGLDVFVDKTGNCHREPPGEPVGLSKRTAFVLGCNLKTMSMSIRDEGSSCSFDEPQAVLFECFNLNGRSLCVQYGRHDVSGWRWTENGFERLSAFDHYDFHGSSEVFLFTNLDYSLFETLMINFWLDRESYCLLEICQRQLTCDSGVGFFAGI